MSQRNLWSQIINPGSIEHCVSAYYKLYTLIIKHWVLAPRGPWIVKFRSINYQYWGMNISFLTALSYIKEKGRNFLYIVYPFSNIGESLRWDAGLLYGISSWNFMHLGRLSLSENVFKNTPFVPQGWAFEVIRTPLKASEWLHSNCDLNVKKMSNTE